MLSWGTWRPWLSSYVGRGFQQIRRHMQRPLKHQVVPTLSYNQISLLLIRRRGWPESRALAATLLTGRAWDCWVRPCSWQFFLSGRCSDIIFLWHIITLSTFNIFHVSSILYARVLIKKGGLQVSQFLHRKRTGTHKGYEEILGIRHSIYWLKPRKTRNLLDKIVYTKFTKRVLEYQVNWTATLCTKRSLMMWYWQVNIRTAWPSG